LGQILTIDEENDSFLMENILTGCLIKYKLIKGRKIDNGFNTHHSKYTRGWCDG
jgi:hypothetical protein